MTISATRETLVLDNEGKVVLDDYEYDQDALARERLDDDLDTSRDLDANLSEDTRPAATGTTATSDSLNTGVAEPDESNTIRIIHNEGEEKPWELKFDDISGLKKARAILNYPVHKFETEQKAWEVAEMLRNIIRADAVVDEEGLAYRDKDDNRFFEPIKT